MINCLHSALPIFNHCCFSQLMYLKHIHNIPHLSIYFRYVSCQLNMADTYRYIEEFKRDYRKYGKFDLERQIPHLAGLADHYMRRYHKSKNWIDCLKVGGGWRNWLPLFCLSFDLETFLAAFNHTWWGTKNYAGSVGIWYYMPMAGSK